MTMIRVGRVFWAAASASTAGGGHGRGHVSGGPAINTYDVCVAQRWLPDERRSVTEVVSALDTHDVRFPTSRHLDGSDAMNPFPDYSAAYVALRTSDGDTGYGFAFTVGRGNDVQVAGIKAIEPLIVGLPVDEALADLGAFGRRLTRDSQLRWLGPEKGVIHMAASAVINAAWDLKARRAGLPLWRLLTSLTPEELVALVDFRYLRDALDEDEALAILRGAATGRAE